MQGSKQMGNRIFLRVLILSLAVFCALTVGAQQQNQPAIDEWRDDFEGEKLDEAKWEIFTFDGGGRENAAGLR